MMMTRVDLGVFVRSHVILVILEVGQRTKAAAVAVR